MWKFCCFIFITFILAAKLYAIPDFGRAINPSDIRALTDMRVLTDVRVLTDTSFESDASENEFQEDLNELFTADSLDIDTTGWSNEKINAARFDYRLMKDTLAITLADSAKKRMYVPPVKGEVTSDFGLRRFIWHYGTDIRLKTGDTVRCAFEGIVRVIQNDRYGYGKVVVVRHPDGLETLYGHLSKLSVTINQRIKAGETVGLGGNTGRSTGSHLHFEIRFRGEPFDPNCIIDFHNFSLKKNTLTLKRDDFAYLAAARQTIYHTVRRGETLGKIARHYGMSLKNICSLNRIRKKTALRVGSRLVIHKNNLPPPLLSFNGNSLDK